MNRCFRKMISMFIVFAVMVSILPTGYVKAETDEFVIEDGKLISYNGDSTSIIIPDTVNSIDDYAFSYSYYLKEITIPYSVESIGEYTLFNCWYLENVIVDLDNEIYSSYEGCLYNKNQTQLIWFPNGKAISLPANLTNIDENLMYNFYYLEGITVDPNNSAYSSYDNCLYNKAQTELLFGIYSTKVLSIPASVTKISSNFIDSYSRYNNLESITVDSTNKNFSSYDGCLYNKKQTQLLIYPKQKTEVKISQNLKKLDFELLSGSYYLSEITIPNNVKTLKNKINSSVVIYCDENSTAHKYAVKNKVSYSLISGKNMISIPSKVSVKKISTNSVDITWKKTSGVVGYEIYRSTNKEKGYEMVTSIKDVNKISYLNKKVKKGNTYYYKIRAYKNVNGIKVYSGFSKVSKIQM